MIANDESGNTQSTSLACRDNLYRIGRRLIGLRMTPNQFRHACGNLNVFAVPGRELDVRVDRRGRCVTESDDRSAMLRHPPNRFACVRAWLFENVEGLVDAAAANSVECNLRPYLQHVTGVRESNAAPAMRAPNRFGHQLFDRYEANLGRL